MIEVLTNFMEEYSDVSGEQNQESNIGLVVDGEVCRHSLVGTRCFCFVVIRTSYAIWG